jgi:hypothetical protein
VPLQRWQSICRIPSPTQFMQPRPQHSEMSNVPTPWQRGHGEALSEASSIGSA